MNKITEVTRSNIFDFIRVENLQWSGRLEEVDFLSRIFNLSELPSSDHRFNDMAGDIWQHRVNNPNDWPDDWIYSDHRLDLLNCDDSVLLQFLCETIHPLVRRDPTETKRLQQIYNDLLKMDGFEIIEKTKVSGHPIFAARIIISDNVVAKRSNTEINKKLNAEYVANQINLMETSIEKSPYIAIGVAKELIETCCQKVLTERNIKIDKKWDLLDLVKNTNKILKLTPDDILDQQKASKTIRTILGSLSAVVHGICELRNDYGSGHGKDLKFKGLNSRHAKLAVGAASTLAIFILETHEIKS